MKKGSLLAIILLFVAGMLLSACGSNENSSGDGNSGNGGDYKTELTLGTGSTGGVYYPLGGEIATVLNDNIDEEEFDVSSVESGASVENIAKMHEGKFQLGMAQNTTGFNAVNGEEDFDGKGEISDFGVIASLYPEALMVVTLDSTGIDNIGDLKGKKVAIGPPGGATRVAAEKVLAAHGVEEGDYDAYEEGFGDGKDKLQNGNIDAMINVVGVPSSAVSELQAATKEVKFLDLNDEAVSEFEDDTNYVEYNMEAGTYDWQDEDVQTVTAMAALMASKDQVSEDLGYEITKNLFEHTDDMSIDQANLIEKESALKGTDGLPIHPGAKKYYEEEGILE